jgi:hypothetical protein
MLKRLALLLLPCCLSGCPGDDKPPGDENMGIYNFRAEAVSIACGLPDIPTGGFDFSGTFYL